jgi:hypothetical protein
MSQLVSDAAVSIATITEKITSAAIKAAATDACEAVMIGLASSIPQIMTVAGLLSKSYVDSTGGGTHPASLCSEDGILLAALLLARSAQPNGRTVAMSLGPDHYANAIRDFNALRPLVALDSFIRGDVLEMASNTHGELLAGILSN